MIAIARGKGPLVKKRGREGKLLFDDGVVWTKIESGFFEKKLTVLPKGPANYSSKIELINK